MVLKKPLSFHLRMFVYICLPGDLPDVSKGTHVIVPLVEELQDNCWEAKIVEQKDTKIKLSVNSLPTAAIGKYRLGVATRSPTGEAMSPYSPDNDIYMLFNPWCEGENKGGVREIGGMITSGSTHTVMKSSCSVIYSGTFHKYGPVLKEIKAQFPCLLYMLAITYILANIK